MTVDDVEQHITLKKVITIKWFSFSSHSLRPRETKLFEKRSAPLSRSRASHVCDKGSSHVHCSDERTSLFSTATCCKSEVGSRGSISASESSRWFWDSFFVSALETCKKAEKTLTAQSLSRTKIDKNARQSQRTSSQSMRKKKASHTTREVAESQGVHCRSHGPRIEVGTTGCDGG